MTDSTTTTTEPTTPAPDTTSTTPSPNAAAAPAADAAPAATEPAKVFNQTTEGGDAPAEPPAEPEKPIEYTDFILPDDFTADADAQSFLKDFGKEHKLPQEAAQKLVDKFVDIQRQMLVNWENTQKEWADEVKADPEYGGAKLAKSQDTANKIIDRFGDKGLVDDLVALGLGNKLSVMRFTNKVAAEIGRLEAKIADLTKEDNTGDGASNQGGKQPEEPRFESIWKAEHKS